MWVRGRFEEYTLRLLQAAARQQHAWTMPTDDDETRRLYDTELPRQTPPCLPEGWRCRTEGVTRVVLCVGWGCWGWQVCTGLRGLKPGRARTTTGGSSG